jgi:hypothetical protein
VTAQSPDILLNECADVDLRGLRLYRVAVGSPMEGIGEMEPYEFHAKPTPPTELVRTGLWRGYISRYRLDSSGRLILESFEYPARSGASTVERVDEELQDDFWMLMAPSFFDDRIGVPFSSGRVIGDKARWEFDGGLEQATWECRACRHRNSYEGLVCGRCRRSLLETQSNNTLQATRETRAPER